MHLLAHRLERFGPLNAAEKAALDTLSMRVAHASRNQLLLRPDDSEHHTVLIHTGWAMVHRELHDGRRQIMQFCLPGDLIDPCSLLREQRDFGIQAITSVRYSLVSLNSLTGLIESHPRLAFPLLWNEAREIYFLRCHLLSIGRLTARERLASLLLELWDRLAAAGETKGARLPIHANQTMLADATGLSSVHVSRTLNQLEQEHLITRRRSHEWALDLSGLRRLVPDMLLDLPVPAMSATDTHSPNHPLT